MTSATEPETEAIVVDGSIYIYNKFSAKLQKAITGRGKNIMAPIEDEQKNKQTNKNKSKQKKKPLSHVKLFVTQHINNIW